MSRGTWRCWGVLLALSTPWAGFSADPPSQDAAKSVGLTNDVRGFPLSSNVPLQQLSSQQFRLGQVVFDKSKRTLTFPCTVNMNDGVIEYALVHATGKVHESVLKTDAEPYHIHLARLFMAEATTNWPGSAVTAAPELVGLPVSIWLSWTDQGAQKRARLEDFISNTITRSAMSRGEWVYNGSRVVDGVFLAQRDGSIVTVIADPDAMVNNPRPGRNDDEIWRANSPVVPPVGTGVEVTVQLEKSHEN